MSEEPGIYNVPQTKDQIRRHTFTQIGQIERAVAALQMSLNEIDAGHICSDKNKQLFRQINHKLSQLPREFKFDYEDRTSSLGE